MEDKLNNWERLDQSLDEYILLTYEEYSGFRKEQDNIYQDLFVEKLLKNDSIKFY